MAPATPDSKTRPSRGFLYSADAVAAFILILTAFSYFASIGPYYVRLMDADSQYDAQFSLALQESQLLYSDLAASRAPPPGVSSMSGVFVRPGVLADDFALKADALAAERSLMLGSVDLSYSLSPPPAGSGTCLWREMAQSGRPARLWVCVHAH